MSPVSSPGHHHMLDVGLMLRSSQPDLHHAAMCCDTYLPETTGGRLSTYTGQLSLAGSLQGGDVTMLVMVAVVHSPAATSSLNLHWSCYTTKHSVDPWQGAAYALPNNSSSSPTHTLAAQFVSPVFGSLFHPVHQPPLTAHSLWLGGENSFGDANSSFPGNQKPCDHREGRHLLKVHLVAQTGRRKPPSCGVGSVQFV